MTSPTEPPEMSDDEPTETDEPTASAESPEPAEPASTDETDTTDEPTATEEPATSEEPAEAAEVAESASTEPDDETATRPATGRHDGLDVPVWREWFGRHRRAVLIVAGVLVVGLVATFSGLAIASPGPKDVVEDYLDALRAGDTDAALDIVGKPNPGSRLDFVTTDAMADGWTVDAVVVRNERDSGNSAEADVDVTISTKKKTESTQGRFHVVERDGEWRIDSPFVVATLEVRGMDTITLGRVTRTVRVEPTGGVPVLLFPGAYRPELGNRVSLSPNEFIAAPTPDEEFTQGFAPTMELTDEGVEQAQRAVDAHIDACVQRAEVEPTDCPFSADNLVGYWAEVKSVAWQVTAYPEGVFEPSDTGGFRMITRKPGTVRLTGTGFEEDPPAKRFAATCEFGVGDPDWGLLTVDVSGDEVTINPDDSGSGADLATRCH
jgi:hypothetical protein